MSFSSAASGRISRARLQQRERRAEPLAQLLRAAPTARAETACRTAGRSSRCCRSRRTSRSRLTANSLSERLARDVQAGQVEAFGRGHVADRRLHGVGLAAAAVENPLDHAQVLAVARPEELAVLIGAEPVDVEDLGRVGHPPAHVQPVLEVVAHVVAAEGQHGHRVAADFAELAELGGRALRGHRRADEHAVLPVERLVDQRRQVAPRRPPKMIAEIGTPW